MAGPSVLTERGTEKSTPSTTSRITEITFVSALRTASRRCRAPQMRKDISEATSPIHSVMCKALIGQPDRDALVIVDDPHPHRLQRSWRILQPVPLTTPTLPGSPPRCQGLAYPGDASPLAPRTVRSPSPCPPVSLSSCLRFPASPLPTSQSARPSLVGKRSCSAFRTFRATSDNRCGRPTERYAPAPSVFFARQSRDQIAYAARRALIRLASSGRRFCFAILRS
jgi:hypothetical protein